MLVMWEEVRLILVYMREKDNATVVYVDVRVQ